ncbi:hypothetical protein JOE61_001507 [Nocardioides salarius]|uniref:DUF6318 domain-containing protein n=1 Tax=Nocardioides salarius TaxID=374513 RepID=A0ABS2M929_9ACTN|nr:DUF6318 family protein [Nocardioides salarius]MBM7507693.1 hypothetical protein [Nocardioides salarius]
MRRHLAYAAGAAVLALAGCGGDDPTPQVADPTPSASVSASPSASAAVEKEAWEKKTEAGAEAFAKRWVRAFNEMQASGEVGEFENLSTSECETCRNFVEMTDQAYANGGRIESDGWRIRSVAATSLDVPNGHQFALRVRQLPQQIFETAEAEPTSFPGGTVTFLSTVVWQSGGWRMSAWEFPA